MRVFLTTAALLAAALVGYLSPARVSAKQDAILSQAGIVQGEKVRLVPSEPSRGSQECTVIALHGDFLGCRNESQSIGQPGYTRWYNLKLIVRIDRPSRSDQNE